MIKIYNTLTRKKEEFIPIEQGRVTMYLCGPTVYNYIHIGNARSAVAFDTIRRFFEYTGLEVDYVSNFTDVDDKIVAAAEELQIAAPDLAEKFIEAFFEDTGALFVKKATANPRVMQNIPEIIAFIEELIEKDYAYEVEGDVYYRTRKFSDYGKLSGITIDELRVGASERLDDKEAQNKEDEVDFALWKKAKADEISWDSPWSKGRPGWHIECSTLARKYLGETIDIHAGGQDLTFPHHENEIAQTEAVTDKTFANYWMHNGFVTMGDEKMSKSLGNVKLVRDLLEEYKPEVIRFFLSATHYRRPLVYSKAAIEDAGRSVEYFKTAIHNAYYHLDTLEINDHFDQEIQDKWAEYLRKFSDAMKDDFQTQNALAVVYEMIKEMNRQIEKNTIDKTNFVMMIESLEEILAIYGLTNLRPEKLILDHEIEEMIAKREKAREEKDFEEADLIRDTLKERGIILEDTPQGIRWKKDE